MNAFDRTRVIEARGLKILMPFLEDRAHEGRVVLCNKGPLAKAMQQTLGDALFNSDADTVYSVEFKVEEENKWGNLFLETWSNRNLDNRNSHGERGTNPGWMLKLQADFLFYYFLDTDDLYVAGLFKLKRWAFVKPGTNGNAGRIYDYPEKQQEKRIQANDTWGRCVPINVLIEQAGVLHYRARQLALELPPPQERAA